MTLAINVERQDWEEILIAQDGLRCPHCGTCQWHMHHDHLDTM